MKLKRITACTFFLLLTFWGYTQMGEADKVILSYYQQRAISDAELEKTLKFSSVEDEVDYWKDQLNFEKQLKAEEYSAYKTYIFFKRKAYLEHQEECDILVNHGKGYHGQAFFYATHGVIGQKETGDISGNLHKAATLASQRH